MIKNANILVISEKRGTVRAATRALVSAGCQVTACGFDAEALGKHLSQPRDLIIVDAAADDEQLVRSFGAIGDRQKNAIALLVSSNLSDRRIFDQILGGTLSNVIARSGGMATQEVLDETELITTCDKLLTGDIFGLQKYLPVQLLSAPRKIEITHTDGREEALKSLDKFLDDIDSYQGMKPMILAVADELLMNAIFSAPRDEKGMPKYDTRGRRSSFALEPSETVEFAYACDGKNVLMSVTDRFGALDREVITKYLGRGLMGEKGEVESKEGGAGLGLYMVVHSISNLVFNIHAKKRTEVIATFHVRSGLRGFRTYGQTLNLFLLP